MKIPFNENEFPLPRKKKKGLKDKAAKRARRLNKALAASFQLPLKAIRGKGLHVVVTGFSQSCMDEAFCRIVAGAPRVAAFDETQALDTVDCFHGAILTKHRFDLLNWQEIQRRLGKFRQMVFVVAVEDPVTLLCSTLPEGPGLFEWGYDYGLFKDGPTKSLTDPGLGAYHEALEGLIRHEGTRPAVLLIHRELLGEHGSLLDKLSHALSKETTIWNTPIKLPVQQPDKLLPTSCVANDLPGRQARRLSCHFQLFPGIFAMREGLGYAKGIQPEVPACPASKQGTIVLFHTDDPIYTAEAKRCVASIERLGLPYDITVIPPGGSWVENCAMKPRVILEARRRLRGPLLYMDVDAVVHEDPWPYLAQYTGDMAVYVHHTGELISSAIFLQDTEKTEEILQAWLEIQMRFPKVWDQRVLQWIMEEDESSAHRFQFDRLPPNFTYIFDKKFRHIHGKIFIEQLQVSREVKEESSDEALARRKARLRQLSQHQE